MNAKPLYLHTLSPLHVGTGRGTGLVDLPIAREKATHYPMVPGSAIKGVIRDAHARQNKDLTTVWFGDTSDDSAQAGSLIFGDAYLLLMPVRALRGTFAWVTCPAILRRLQRDLQQAKADKVPQAIPAPATSEALVEKNSFTWNDSKVILEDLDLTAKKAGADDWADFLASTLFSTDWQVEFLKRFLIVSDETFDFLCEFGTEVRARVRLTEEKTVAKGALWYEESLPAEAVLAGMVWEDAHLSKGKTQVPMLNLFKDLVNAHGEFQFGGKATTGHGRVVLKVGA